MPRVSIILACYNVADFIDEALASIVAQSEFSQFEIIPVDDGSTDATWSVIERYRRQHPEHFFPIHFDQGSGGPGRPRNAGLDRATGDYVIFMDPDDRIYQDGYSLLLHAIDQYRSDVVIATRYGVPEKAGPEARVWVDWLAPEPYVNDGSATVKRNLLEQRPVILKTIYRRDRIEQWGLRFLEGVASTEDEIFDKKFLLLSDRITKINDVVYLYTVARSGSITSKITSKVFEDLHVLLPALDDAIRVYFDDTVVAMRIAGLLRTFYLPKLLLMDRTARPRGLDQIKTACENYGYHRLLLSPKRADRRTVRLLRDNRDGQLLRSVELYSFLRSRRTAKIIYDVANKALWRGRYLIRRTRSMARTAVRLSKLAVRPGGPAKIWATVIRRNLEAGPNGYWLFMDRPDKAADNAEALYRYVRSAGLHDRIAFVMTDGAADWTRLSRDHFTLVPFNTLAQWRLLYNCEHFFTSHPDDPYIYPWRQFGGGRGNPRYKLDFLQHGIIRSDLSSWLGTKPFNTFCASSPIEYQGLLANPRYHLTPDILKLTGLARHDLLGGEPQNYILVFPTWRSFLRGAAPEQFLQSEFFISWRALLADQKLAHTLQERGLTLKLVLHSGLAEHAMHFPGSSAVDVLDFDGVDSFAELLSGARMLVTDYSSISFDMIYLRRPVVYFNFYESRAHSANAGARLDVYESLGERTTTVSQTVDAVLRMIDDEFVPAPEKLDAANGFFAFGVDGRNRKRIMDAVLRKDEQP